MTTPLVPDRLFVYGTLLPGEPRWHFLQQYVDDEGVVDSVAGHLFDTGCGYPAAVFSHVVFGDAAFSDVVLSGAASLIHGRVFVLDVGQLDHALDVLDQVEGAVDGRDRRVQVVSESGSTAWAYAYGEGLVLTPIAHGCWLDRNG